MDGCVCSRLGGTKYLSHFALTARLLPLLRKSREAGYARTELIANGPGADAFLSKISMFLQPIMSQSAAAGALPTLSAATSPEANGGAYYGPDGCYEMKGSPAPAHVAPRAKDAPVARRLRDLSERLTGVNWRAGEECPKSAAS
jgi:hypothetical protein